jgi:hypothetical protein
MPACAVDALDQIGNDWACGKRHEADRGAESYLIAEDRRPPQQQGDARRTNERGIVDVLDVGECDALLLAAFFTTSSSLSTQTSSTRSNISFCIRKKPKTIMAIDPTTNGKICTLTTPMPINTRRNPNQTTGKMRL